MTVLCGTDFSPDATRAVDAAAAWASALHSSLHLVHVLDIPGAEEVLAQDVEARVTRFFREERDRLSALLDAERARLADHSIAIETEVLAGSADEAILGLAARLRADLVVVGAVGRRGDGMWRLGSTADHIAQRARCAVLVVRNEQPIRAWSHGERALRAVVGVDLTPTSDAALHWIRDLATAAEVDASAVYVYWPPDLRDRLRALEVALGKGDRSVQSRVEGELKERIAGITKTVSVPLRFIGGLGRPADHLAQVAAEESADVLVIGTHQRTGASRMWHGSVSHDAIVRAPTNVVVVSTATPAA
jgi:nucleotide-binding universal stress UspA family protein